MEPKIRIYKLKDLLDKIDSASAWSSGRFVCYACRRTLTSDKFDISVGSLCKACVEGEFKKTVKNVALDAWSIPQFMQALEALGSFRSRLTVLWRFHEVLRLAIQKSPSDVDQLKKLLVRNLGFVQDHPLAQAVRQAAFQASVAVGKPLLPLLLSMCETTPWQFYANVIMTLGKIDPDNPEVRALIEKAAKAKNPEIRERAQAALEKQGSSQPAKSITPQKPAKSVKKTLTKQERLQTVVNKLDPALRDLVRIGPEQQHLFGGTAYQPILIESPAEKKMENAINQVYTMDALKKIYKIYLQDYIFSPANFKVKGNFSVNKLKKADLIRALAKVYANQNLFQMFFDRFPSKIQEIFQTLIWEGEEHEAEALEKAYNVKIISSTQKQRYGTGAQDVDHKYLVFQLRTQYFWAGFSGSSYKYYLSLPDSLRKVFKLYLPFPKGYDLIPLDTIDETPFLYENQDRILKHIKLYYSYIAQGNLKFSQSTGKLLKSSLTQMTKYCSVDEFYNTKDKKLQYLKTQLIIDFLQGIPCDTAKAPDKLLKQLFQDFFQKTHPKSKKLYEFLYHLKGSYYEYQYDKREKRVKQALLNLLKDFPPSQWLSFEHLEKYCFYRDIMLNVTDRKSYGSDLYFNRKDERSFRSRYERTYVRSGYYKDAVITPFLKSMMFLFAAFGIVDIAYELPENSILQERDLKYLSFFDGLQYVRLTKLGAYVIGLTNKYAAAIEEETAKIELDPKRLILTVEGKDPLKTLIINKIANQISENCYKVNYHSFLKECTTKKDIKQKVALFHEYITVKLPPVWQEFLDDVLDKINPLVSKQKMSVFKLKPNQELVSLVARDDVLKQCILKAEEYHILIAENDIPKVKKRLEEFGYFIDNI